MKAVKPNFKKAQNLEQTNCSIVVSKPQKTHANYKSIAMGVNIFEAKNFKF